MNISTSKDPKRYYLLAIWASAFFATWVAIGFALFGMSATKVSLFIDMTTTDKGVTQLFLGENGAYSESNSILKRVNDGRNQLLFPLPSSFSSLRWDPPATGETLVIHDLYVTLYGIRASSENIALSPLFDIDEIKQSKDRLSIKLSSSSLDPQLVLGLEAASILKKRVLFSGIVGLALSLILVGGLYFRKELDRWLAKADLSLSSLIEECRRDRINLKELGVLIAIGSLMYIYFLSTFSLSVDDEMASVRSEPAVWVSQGRWFTYLVEKFVFPQPAIPFAPYIFLVIALAFSYALMLRAHGYRSNWKTYFLYPTFCAFPTWWFIAEFASNVPALAVGVLFVSFSIYLFFSETNGSVFFVKGSLPRNMTIVLLLSFAIASYQSLLLVFICIVFGALLLRSLHGAEQAGMTTKEVKETVSRAALLSFVSLVLYFLINKAAQSLIVGDSGYLGGFTDYGRLLEDPFLVFGLVFDEMLYMYTGDSLRYGDSIFLAGFVLLLSILVAIFSRRSNPFLSLFLWLGILVSPFLFHFMSGGAPLPMRSMIAVAYVSWLASLLLLSHKRPSFMFGSLALVGLYQIQLFSLSSQYIASATITQSHDRILAADIYRRIGEMSGDFDREAVLTLDIYGRKYLDTIYADGWSSAIQGSFFSWDDGNIYRMVTYMKVMGYENIMVPTHDRRVSMTPLFEKMPVWPAADSVRKVGDTFLVKLSEKPDPTHAQFVE